MHSRVLERSIVLNPLEGGLVGKAVARNHTGALDRAKDLARRLIACNRRSRAVRLLHKFSGFVDQAYRNVGLDLEVDGESALIKRLRAAHPRVAFDVGANCGDWLVEALKYWPECHFHAFEVAPETFQRLDDRIRQLGCSSRVTLNCAGLSNVNGTREMYYVPEYPNLTTVLRLNGALRRDDYVAVPFNASVLTGDSYVANHQIDAVDFVKIDVEGAEYQVLEGLKDRLSQAKVHCLQFEYCPFAIQTKFLLTDFYSVLAENYWIGKVYPNYVEFRDYEWPMEVFEFANYCAVSRSRPDLREMLS
jgi:FkbM family methyltransferase